MYKQTEDEKLLLARIDDLYTLCDKHAKAKFSPFLNGAMQRTVSEHTAGRENSVMFGGYDGSERKVFGVFPEWDMERTFPIAALKISHSFGEPMTHRDYLGSIMSLGLERGKIGDIIVDGNTAYVFAKDDAAQYIADNLKKIGNRGVKLELCAADNIVIPNRQFEEYSIIVSSMRIDAVIAAAMRISRSSAADYIKNGRVSIEHRVCENASHTVAFGELISVRGFGRFFIDGENGITRRGRRHTVIKKYI